MLLSTTTELLVIDLIAQHDPQPDSQLAGHGHACFSQPLLHQFAPIETPQLRIAACRVSASLIPQRAQQRITLFADSAEPPPSPAGTFLRNQPHVAEDSPQRTQRKTRLEELMVVATTWVNAESCHDPSASLRYGRDDRRRRKNPKTQVPKNGTWGTRRGEQNNSQACGNSGRAGCAVCASRPLPLQIQRSTWRKAVQADGHRPAGEPLRRRVAAPRTR